ncbi:MAG: laccase domain-containing protein, partial [Pseudomonadota bacterium]
MPSFDIAEAHTLDGVPHGFFGHVNGVHQFGYGGEGDLSAIAETRANAAQALVSGAKLAAPHQVHSPDFVTVDEPWDDNPEGRPTADAVVTAQPNIVLGIVTADCAPVLFADREARVIGAAHAGWRGAHAGILENTLAAMEALGATRANIAAAIGPTI